MALIERQGTFGLWKGIARRPLAIVAVLVALAAQPSVFAQRGASPAHWVGTWATVPVARCPGQPAGRGPQGQAFGLCDPKDEAPPPQAGQAPPRPAQAALPKLKNQTVRQIVRTSIGGNRVRVVLTNVYGTVPVEIGAAQVALRDKEAAIVPNSGRPLTFSGRRAMAIPPGAILVSDPVDLTVPPLADLAVDIYLPGDTAATNSPMTVHSGTGSLQTNFVSPTGNHTGAASLPVQEKTLAWLFLARVDVDAPDAGGIVALGDSITDGSQSTPDTNNRWPDHLARRLAAQNMKLGVMNLGFSGNRVLSDGTSVSALARFDRDVLAQPGVTHVIVLDGINDIGGGRENASPSAEDIIAGHRQLIARAHTHGIKIYGATLTPYEGANYFTPQGEAKRQAVNEWIRTSKEYDGVIDFDKAVRDPNAPTKHQPQFDPGDHLHATDIGYKAMADAIDLGLFRMDGRGATH